MEIHFLPNETMLLTFKLANGSGWLTNYRLILCENEAGQLKDQTLEFYFLKGFKEAKIGCNRLKVYLEKTSKLRSNFQPIRLLYFKKSKPTLEKPAKTTIPTFG